jgi:uncharacterized protein (TIGR03437 family)
MMNVSPRVLHALPNTNVDYNTVLPGARCRATGKHCRMRRLLGVLSFVAVLAPAFGQPSVNAGGVVNDASYTAPVAPGSVAAAFGSFAVSPLGSSGTPLSTDLEGLSLVFGAGGNAPLFFVSSQQVNLQVPWELAGQTQTTITASLNGVDSTPQTVTLAPFAPGIFSTNAQGTGQGAIINTAYQLVDTAHPAIPGSTYIMIYCTGLGAVTNQPATGSPAPASPLAQTITTPTVTIGGISVTAEFSGLAPGYVGLYQVNALVPAAVGSGTAVPVSITIGGVTSNTVTIAVQATTSAAAFNTLATSFNNFDPTNVTGMQCVASDGVRAGSPPCGSNLLLTGYQGGDMVNGVAIYPPWVTAGTAGEAWQILNSVIIWFNGGSFTTASSWGQHDMDEDAGYSSTCPNTSTTGYVSYCPGGYNSGIVVGSNYYLVPGAAATLPVYAMINTAGSGGLSNGANYSYVNGSVVTSGSLGAATGFYDGRYVHYIPSVDTVWVRHDTTQDSGNKLSTSGWSFLNLVNTCGLPSKSWLGGVWDGHRYAYGLPGTGNPASSIMVRFDSAAPFGCSAFTEIDLSQLGTTGYPQVQGSGAVSDLRGLSGGVIAIDGNTTNGTVWLYGIPWETSKTSFSGTQTLGTTAFRVICGTYAGGVFTPADVTSSSAVYEVVDLSFLLTNPEFLANGWNTSPGTYFTSSTALRGEPTVGGFQLGWFNPMTGRAVFNASDGLFELEFNPSAHLWDPTGIYVGLADDPDLAKNNFGGPISFGGIGQTVIYPSTPTPIGGHGMVQISGL